MKIPKYESQNAAVLLRMGSLLNCNQKLLLLICILDLSGFSSEVWLIKMLCHNCLKLYFWQFHLAIPSKSLKSVLKLSPALKLRWHVPVIPIQE